MIWTTIGIFSLLFLIGNVDASKHPKIIGGIDTNIKDFPHLVSMRFFGEHFCAGSIISDRHILTAAHCMNDLDDFGKMFLRIHSGTSRSDKIGTVHKVKSAHVHPKWQFNETEGWPNDIAILTLEDPIVFNKKTNKINLPSHNIKNYQLAYAAGWGKTTNKGNITPKKLKKLQVYLLLNDKCRPLITHKLTEKQICSFRPVESGVCYGDSGGPLVSHDELVGITSFVDKDDCATGVPDVYTNVFAYKDFIKSVMNDTKL